MERTASTPNNGGFYLALAFGLAFVLVVVFLIGGGDFDLSSLSPPQSQEGSDLIIGPEWDGKFSDPATQDAYDKLADVAQRLEELLAAGQSADDLFIEAGDALDNPDLKFESGEELANFDRLESYLHDLGRKFREQKEHEE